MGVALISILSGSAAIVPSGGDESSQDVPFNAKPFGEMMASAAQEAQPDSETLIDNAQIGQLIDQVPAMLLHENNANALAGLAQAQGLTVSSSDIATLAVATVGEQDISHSAAAMLAPLDIEPVAWSVAEPEVVEIVEEGVAIEVDVSTGTIADQSETALRALPVDETLPNIAIDDDLSDTKLPEEGVEQLIGSVQADVVDSTEITVDEVVSPLVAIQENVAPAPSAQLGQSAIAATQKITTDSSAPTIPSVPAATGAPATPSVPAMPAPASAESATPDEDAELNAVIERVLSQASKAPANQNSANQNIAQPASHSPSSDLARNVTQPEIIDKVDALHPQISAHSHATPHEGADRFASLTVLKSEPLFQGRPATASEQVQVTVQQAMKSGLDRVVIELDPADLGRVEVRMDMAKEGRVHVMVIADNRNTLDQLKQDSQDLQRALQDAGLEANAGNMEFHLGGGDSGDEYNDEFARAYGDAVEDARTPDENYIDPLTGHYTVMVNEGLDIKV